MPQLSPRRKGIGRTVAAVVVVALLAGSAVGTAAAATPNRAADASSSTYAGAHVSFHASGNALSNYAVENTTVFDTVKVGSSAKGGLGGSLSSSLSSTTHVEAAGLSVASKSRASATVKTQSGATMRAHDDDHGILTVHAGGSNQTVVANLSSSGRASAENEDRVAVTASDGTEGTFVVVGNGSVAVNDAGNVTATLGPHATLAYRAYPDGKTAQDDATEKLIANGTAAAEVSVSNRDGSMVTDVVNYTSDFSASATQTAKHNVTVTADNAHHDGKIVITSVSNQAVGTLSNLSVTVDGHAAAEASSSSALRAATSGSQSKYLVRQSSSSSASATVYVAFNHFSTRRATISGNQQDTGSTTTTTTTSSGSGGSSTTTSSGDGGSNGGSTTTAGASSTTSASSPGFGVAAIALALVGAAVAVFRRQT